MGANRDLRLNSVPGFTSYIDGTGVLVSASSSEYIVISDIMASTTGILKEDNSSGDTVITVASAGHSNLVSPIQMKNGKDLFNDNSDMKITVCYWKGRA